MPNPRRNVKDEFWVVVLVAVIIVAALITMWWKWIILCVLLVALGFILKAVLKKVPSKREPFAPSQRAQIERQDDSNKQVKTEYPKASEKQESYNAKTSPRVCAFVDCKTPVLPYDTLCSEHYQKRKDGLINQCPNCGTFKDAKYPLCSACYHQQKPKIEHSKAWEKADKERTRWFVYILKLDNGEFYVGQTGELRERLMEHRDGRTVTLKGQKGKLQYFEILAERTAAELRESELKLIAISNPRQIRRMIIELKDLIDELNYE
jgi:predicted GIY-YIG superfamily endonuclease